MRVLMMFVVMFAGGLAAFNQLNIEAYPDPTPPMVDVVTQSPGLSAEEIERYITIGDVSPEGDLTYDELLSQGRMDRPDLRSFHEDEIAE